MDCFGTYFTNVQTSDNVRVQSATQGTASVHALYMSKPLMGSNCPRWPVYEMSWSRCVKTQWNGKNVFLDLHSTDPIFKQISLWNAMKNANHTVNTCTHFQSSTHFLQRLFWTHRSAQTPNCAMAQPCGRQMRYWASALLHHGANLSPVSPLPRNRATAQWRKPVASRPATALWSQLVVASTMEQTCGQ